MGSNPTATARWKPPIFAAIPVKSGAFVFGEDRLWAHFGHTFLTMWMKLGALT